MGKNSSPAKAKSVLTIENSQSVEAGNETEAMRYVRHLFDQLRVDMQGATDRITIQMSSMNDKIDAMENANTLLENTVNSLNDQVEEVRASGAGPKKGVKVPNKKADNKTFSPKKVRVEPKPNKKQNKKDFKNSKLPVMTANEYLNK